MKLKLSKRLSAVADMITKGSGVADIGTDHGYIPIYLVQNGLCRYAVATDINEGPLERARGNIRRFGVEDMVSTRLCDGLLGLEAGETDTIVIAGMGGLLITRILESAPDRAHAAKELILSPHSDADALRAFLARNFFVIADESMVKEDGKFYFIIRAVNGSAPVCEGAALYYGLPLLKRRDAVLREYLERELSLREKIIGNLQSNSEDKNGRIAQLEAEITIIKEGFNFYEGC
ncbi:MAG: class I SAM-dependent methyltransferase [Butyrivibrio sp.]|nr:class I SAM-dependent methyltransferase [Butyrivibrio sp.]